MFSVQMNWGSPSKICNREDFERVIDSPSQVRRMAQCRDLSNQLNGEGLFSLTAEEKRKLQEQFSKLKGTSPVFTFQANFPDGRRLQRSAVLSGLVMLDIDHICVDTILAQWASIFGTDPADRWALWQKMHEELGVLMVHITPSYFGLRVVAKACMEGDLSWNQHRLAEALGVQADEACKDASRCSFAVSRNEMLYINPQIFTYENPSYEARYGAQYRTGHTPCGGYLHGVSPAGVVVSRGGAAEADTVAGGPVVAAAPETGGCAGPDGAEAAVLTYCGIPYTDIIAEWWHMNGGEPQEGERNVKLLQLASQLRYICDNRPEKILAVLPTYGLSEEEVGRVVQRACEYKLYSSIPKRMQAVLDSLQPVELPDGAPSDELYTRYIVDFGKRLDRLKMPPALKAVMSGVDPHLRVGALLASLPMFFTLLSRVRFRHYDGSECRLSGMTFIVGPAASGKGFIKDLDAILMESLRLEDKPGRELEEAYRQSKELNKNKKEQMKRPTPCIRIVPSQTSNTKLAERMQNAYDPEQDLHLHCYTLESELSTVVRASKGGSWISRNDVFCKSFHNEYWGLDYASDCGISGEVQVNLNLVISGTEDSMDALIPTGTILSGLPTRIMYFPMPDSRFKMLDLKHTVRTEEQMSELRDVSFGLSHAGGWVDAAPLTRAMYKWCARMTNRACIENDVELDDLRKRTPLIGVRAGIVYAILQQWRSYVQGRPLKIGADAVRFAEFVADFCLTMQYAKFASRMKEQKAKCRQYSGVRKEVGKNGELYNRLASNFTSADMVDEGFTSSAVAHQLRRWVERGFVRKLKHGNYEKVIVEV